jgi:histidine triad (HIT) family protein
MASCIFCKILAGKKTASEVYRDESCCAFLDIRPVNPGHTLVIPLAHAAGLAELDAETGAQMFRIGKRIAAALRKSGIRCEGVNFHLADGAAAGQEVFHVHLHVVPRFQGDGFGLRFGPNYGLLPSRGELDENAAKLSAALQIEI